MKVKQFRYSSDNFAYLVYGEREAAAVDGGDVDGILSFVESNGLTLKYVLNTHTHMDHMTGNKPLLNRSDATFLDIDTLKKDGKFSVDGFEVKVLHTPGHTEDSLTFVLPGILITGDTLFNGTVGNCFSGDLRAFYESVKTLMAFPDDTMVYAGHDYYREAVAFAKTIEKENPDLDLFLEKYTPEHVFSILADEYKANPYLRFNDEKMIAIMKEKNLPVEEEYQRWKSLMEVY